MRQWVEREMRRLQQFVPYEHIENEHRARDAVTLLSQYMSAEDRRQAASQFAQIAKAHLTGDQDAGGR